MELRVNETQLPQPITFNYEELKAAIAEKAEQYATIVYTDDTIKEAKADKASLNKLRKALNDERIRREKEYMKPFNEFKAQVNEIIAIIDKPVKVIDSQIKEYQEKLKTEKNNKIIQLMNLFTFPSGFDTELIWNPKWLNASYPMKQIKAEIEQSLDAINTSLETIEKLEKYSFEARETYLRTLDFGAALATANRLAESERKKAEYEAQRQKRAEAVTAAPQPVKEPEPIKNTDDIQKAVEREMEKPQWIAFKARLSVSQARELRAFCDDHGIELKAIREE